MRIVFLGTPAAALPSLDALVTAGHDVRLVVTRPDRASGRSRSEKPPPVKERALALGVPVIQPDKVRDAAFRDALAAAAPDALAVVAYGRILGPPILELARHGAINLHFSLLPKYRGAAPVAWALARGETETGVTTFRLDRGLDTGPLLLQETLAIVPGEHAPALTARLAERGAALLARTLDGLSGGGLVPAPQDDAAATRAPILTRADGTWDPAWSAADLEGRVRGFDPWPGVWARREAARLRIVDAALAEGGDPGASPGTVVAIEARGARIACAGGTAVWVASVQPEGRRAISAREAANGRQLAVGDRLGGL